MAETVTDDRTLANVMTPPLRLENNKKAQNQLRLSDRKPLGAIIICLQSYEENDNGAMLKEYELEENPPALNK